MPFWTALELLACVEAGDRSRALDTALFQKFHPDAIAFTDCMIVRAGHKPTELNNVPHYTTSSPEMREAAASMLRALLATGEM